MSAPFFKLDHDWFISQLSGHAGAYDHFSPAQAYGFVNGIYFFLRCIGFSESESDRVILEHLLPGYSIERIRPGKVFPGHRHVNQFTTIADQHERGSTDEPFGPESEQKIMQLYSDPEHSVKFWRAYQTEWLPRHLQFIQAREKNRSFVQKLLGDELAWNR